MTRLIADIGGTNARFALAEDGAVRDIEVLACVDYPTLADAAKTYLKKRGIAADDGVFAVAAPLDGTDNVAMMNHEAWQFSIEGTRKELGLKSLHVMNDFTAIALGIPGLSPADYYKIGDGAPQKNMPIGVIGAGTGLGVAGIVFVDGKPVPITTEGGHVTMPAENPREFALLQWLLHNKYHHVSAERVIAGKGLVNLYNAICGVDGLDLPEKSPADITSAALKGECRVCVEVLDLFCRFLGVIAGNLALTYGAFGGIYVAGGIVPQLGDYFKTSRFRESFIAKGRYRDYLNGIPTFVVTHPFPGLEGLKNFS